MTNKERDKSVEIANKLEEEVASLHFKLDYPQIVKLALISAKNIRKEIPMYVGSLNPKWAIYDFTVKLLEDRINGL